MKKYISVIISVILITLTACAQKKSTKTSAISYLKMERTACFGRCPAYMVEVYKNGLVRYTGRQFTEYTGVYEYNIGSKKAQDLFKQFAEKRVDTCKEYYEAYIADLPGLNYGFTINGKQKEIMNAPFGPKYLQLLSGEVDKVSTPGVGWKKVGDLTTK
ncbi:hypothetical protein CAP35_09300 [Chitinophagaceae bacterium IBVUCB1]|nr:hypothetical protein CAP35_09300 [Chitinophagaceae bacterium IBVUCB1]